MRKRGRILMYESFNGKYAPVVESCTHHRYVFCYSYDTRGKFSEIGSHWKNNTVIGERAFFRTLPEPAMLIIEDVKQSDEGPYRCRVDFQKSPTKNHKIWLRVIGTYIIIYFEITGVCVELGCIVMDVFRYPM